MRPEAAARAAGSPASRGTRHFHPLEIIPFFRAFPASLSRDILYTFIWNAGLGLIFWSIAVLLNPRGSWSVEYFVWNQLISQSIGYTLHAMFELGGLSGLTDWVHRSGAVATTVYYTVVSTVGVLVGFSIVAAVLDESLFYNWIRNPRWVGIMAFSSLAISVILSAIFFWRERHARAEAELQRERARSERVERESTLANLRALQAQIEPHFLFNTLANVTSLVDSDPAKAKHMLESFIRFLRASLAATRSEATTLAQDAELIAAYLDVLKVRMGSRLSYTVEVPADLHAFALPPMLLQPVVENAIRHGLEPKVDGGDVAFSARRDGPDVVIEVRDTGVGFSTTTHGGVGLTNLRDRLRALYGERASLAVGDNAPAGAMVTLRLPA